MVTQAKNFSKCNKGFTLIELMIALVVSALVLAATFTIFKKTQDHYTAQLDVTVMQQNVRAALTHITRDIRMAGYGTPGLAKIEEARPDLIYFTADLNEDDELDDAREHIAYDLYVDADGKPVLGRTSSTQTITAALQSPNHWEVTSNTPAHQPVAEYIEHLYFHYLDENGGTTYNADLVQSVVVTLVARAENPDENYKNNQTYTAGDGGTGDVVPEWTKNDNFRRRMQIMTIECRNLGI